MKFAPKQKLLPQKLRPQAQKKKKKNNSKAGVKYKMVKHTSDYTSGVDTVKETVVDPAETLDSSDLRTSTTINYTSGTVTLGVGTVSAVKVRNTIESEDVDGGHSTTTSSGPVKWVGQGKNKHKEVIRTKTKWNLKSKLIHQVKHNVPVKTYITHKKKVKPGQDSTIERVFYNLCNIMAMPFYEYVALSVDKAVLQPNRTFRAQHVTGGPRPRIAPANSVYYVTYIAPGATSTSALPAARFTLPIGAIGDDPYSFGSIASSTISRRTSAVIDAWALRNGFQKLMKLGLWTRDYYAGMFVMNDEALADTSLYGDSAVLYLRRTIGSTGTNAKLATYSDAVWFSNSNTDNVMANRCGWGTGSYLWYRKSTLNATTSALETTLTVHTLDSGGGGYY